MSSANNLTLDLTFEGSSFIYARKRMGPNTDPWGTPDVTGIDDDLDPLTTTLCVRLSKNDCNKSYQMRCARV